MEYINVSMGVVDLIMWLYDNDGIKTISIPKKEEKRGATVKRCQGTVKRCHDTQVHIAILIFSGSLIGYILK